MIISFIMYLVIRHIVFNLNIIQLKYLYLQINYLFIQSAKLTSLMRLVSLYLQSPYLFSLLTQVIINQTSQKMMLFLKQIHIKNFFCIKAHLHNASKSLMTFFYKELTPVMVGFEFLNGIFNAIIPIIYRQMAFLCGRRGKGNVALYIISAKVLSTICYWGLMSFILLACLQSFFI